MKHKKTGAVWFCLALGLAAGRVGAEEDAEHFFPMSRGSVWVYEGEVAGRESQEGGCDDEKTLLRKSVTWKIEALETIRDEVVAAVILDGYPYDLFDGASVEGGKIQFQRGRSLIARRGKEYYLLREGASDSEKTDFAAALELLRSAEKARDDAAWAKIFGDALEWRSPMETGEVLSVDPDEVMNKNVVEEVGQVRLKNIRGVAHPEARTRYKLSNGGNSGERAFSFVPGIGMTELTGEYHPAGCTMLKIRLRLVEFHEAMR